MPEPVVIIDPREEERDFLFDIRTGYAVLDKEPGHFDDHFYGEGSDIFRILRAKRKDVPKQWTPWDSKGARSRVRKLDISHYEANAIPANRIKSGLLNNVYKFKARFVTGSEEDFRAEVAKHDTRLNDVRTVGTGFTFATINAARAASASGDIIDVHGNPTNTYTENITDGALDGIQLVANPDTGNQGITLTSAAGRTLFVSGNHGWYVANFEFNGQGTSTEGVFFNTGGGCVVDRCIAHAYTTTGFQIVSSTSNAPGGALNCRAFDNPIGFGTSSGPFYFIIHCTAVDNATAGFRGNAANRCVVRACLASDNGTDYLNCIANGSAWNVASDGTQPGPGGLGTFTNDNFVNYALGDFDLIFPQNATGAVIDGFPLLREDHLENIRERDTLLFYAGNHDPFTPAVGTVTSLGIIDAAPAAQGSIWIRWWEACFTGVLVPYRYDIHVKRFDGGILTPAEINAGTFFARSVHSDELFGGCVGSGVSGNGPGILQALIAFEAPGDITAPVIPNDENMHLFTNRQYYIAVRAIGIDPTTRMIVEDDNVQVVLSFSTGFQGELWHTILEWPCVKFCDPNAIQNVKIVEVPDLNIGKIPGLKIGEFTPVIEIPPLDILPRGGDYAAGQGSQPGG